MGAEDPAPLAELAAALAPSAERLLETTAQGVAFARTTSAAWGVAVPAMPYPVAVGHAARRLGLPARETATLFVQGFAANLVSAGVRLIPVGQTEGQRIVAGLLPLAARVAETALGEPLAAVGGSAVAADVAAMLHETQYSRLFRS
jgi:urease accessory protein